MAAIVGVVIEGGKDAKKNTIRLPNLPAPGQLIELHDGRCVIVTSVHPMSRQNLIEVVVYAELASE